MFVRVQELTAIHLHITPLKICCVSVCTGHRSVRRSCVVVGTMWGWLFVFGCLSIPRMFVQFGWCLRVNTALCSDHRTPSDLLFLYSDGTISDPDFYTLSTSLSRPKVRLHEYVFVMSTVMIKLLLSQTCNGTIVFRKLFLEINESVVLLFGGLFSTACLQETASILFSVREWNSDHSLCF